MKELREILSKTASESISGVASDSSSATADEPEPGICPRCGGAGFVRLDRPVDHPRFGKAEPCECVLDEEDDTRRQRLERVGNLGALVRFTFATLSAHGRGGDGASFGAAREAAAAYADAPVGWLVLTGPSGCGKTHLAAAIANARVAAGQPALFTVVPDFLDHLRASYEAEAGDLGYDELIQQVRNAPLLFLDDIDAAPGTPWAREKLFQVINHRYNLELPTVFTCTQRPAQLDERLATRLTDPRLAHVFALEEGGHDRYQQVGGMTRDRLATLQFRDFDLRGTGLQPGERDSLEAAFRAAMSYADEPQGWLVLQGANGCGKTHLAAAIANRALSRGTGVFFAVVPDLLDHLRASFAPDREVGYDELFERVRNAGLLVLDDLGAQASSPWAQEKLYQVVNYRTVAGLPTIVTTDQAMDTLQAAHPRIAARIFDPLGGAAIVILAPHYRLGRAAERKGSNPPTSRRR